MAQNQTDIYVAKESFSCTVGGQEIVVHKGQTRVRAGHPLLKGREMYFEPLTVQYDVERATAAPGEQRGATPPTPRTPEAPVRRRAEAPAPDAASEASATAGKDSE